MAGRGSVIRPKARRWGRPRYGCRVGGCGGRVEDDAGSKAVGVESVAEPDEMPGIVQVDVGAELLNASDTRRLERRRRPR